MHKRYFVRYNNLKDNQKQSICLDFYHPVEAKAQDLYDIIVKRISKEILLNDVFIEIRHICLL